MFQRLREDIACILERDPAAHSAFTVLTCYPGLHVLVMHRWAHACWTRGWRWLGRYSTIQSMTAAREAYEALAAEQNIGFVESGHFHCNSMDFAGREQAAIDAYVARFLLDQEVSTDFWDQGVPFEAERWVNWQTPVLQ